MKGKPCYIKPTDHQNEVADYFIGEYKKTGYWPSIREAAAHFEVYLKSIHDVVVMLDRKAILHRIPNTARAFRIGEKYKGKHSGK